jgi:CRISPR system Cascade subunit CasE
MNLYLSRLFLNPRSRQVMSELAQPYEMHRTLMRAFPKTTDDKKSKARDEFGVLFRTEIDDERRAVKLYVQSRIEPDWSFLDGMTDYLCADAERPESKNIMPAYTNIQNGQVFSFRLRANPTKRIAKHNDPMKGKRVNLKCECEQIDWLIRKGQMMGESVLGGFNLLSKEVRDTNGVIRQVARVNICNEGKQKGRKRDNGRDHITTHFAVLFEGLLRVTDKEGFLNTIIRGIGPAKAFGFGLLSVAPV